MRSTTLPVAVAAAAVVAVGVLSIGWQQQPGTKGATVAAPTTAPQEPLLPMSATIVQPADAPPLPTHMFNRVYCPGEPKRAPVENILDLPCETEFHPVCAEEYDPFLASARLLPNRIVHDCQKLIIDSTTYGPLAAVLPVPFVDIVHPPEGGSSSRRRFVLADILVYDQHPYAPLNLTYGLNCLMVTGDPTDPYHWVAEIGQAKSCADATELVKRQPLAVKVLPYSDWKPGMDPVAFALDTVRHPSTARWGWSRGTQFIGVHCGIAWCEFGREGFIGTDAQVGDGIGLRDEQLLSEVDSSVTPPRLRPSRVWGRIEPDPRLGSYDDNALAQRPRVAFIVLTDGLGAPTSMAAVSEVMTKAAPLPKRMKGGQPAGRQSAAHARYFRRYHLTSLVDAVSFTEIYMQRVGTSYSVATKPNPPDWTPTVRCPWKHGPAGGARWRWDSRDEGIWVACSHGCCTTTHIQ